MSDAAEPADTDTAEAAIPHSFAECWVETLQDDTLLVMTPEPGPNGHPVRLASLRFDAGDYWWRGYWSGQWHFGALESDLREMLDNDLKAGRVTV